MEVIHCFNFIILFFVLLLSIVNIAFILRMSYFLVKMFDYMKAIGRDDYDEDEDDEEDDEEDKSGLINLPTVQDYVDENMLQESSDSE